MNDVIKYLKNNVDSLYTTYLKDYDKLDTKISLFTAGPSGAGKTEFAISLLDEEPNLIHLDIDNVRNFFKPLGYTGNNSDLFQKPSSWAVQYLFDEIVKNRGLSFILDSNLTHFQTAKENIHKLLKSKYRIEIFYIYNAPETCFLYTQLRENITHRVVPEDVFFKSIIQSRITTYEIKKLFNYKIILNVVDKRDNQYYKDVSADDFYNIIPEG
jgi:hypothetical protein